VSRFARVTLDEQRDKEVDLSKKAEYIATEIEKEDSPVYGFMMREISEDMIRLSEMFGGLETGDSTQLLGEEINRRLAELAEALKREQEERNAQENQEQDPNEQEQPQDPNQPDQKQPLIPPSAELRMLKRLQEDLNLEVEDISEEVKGEEVLPEDVRREVERLAQRQARLRDLWKKIARNAGLDVDSIESEDAGGEGGGEEGGEEDGAEGEGR
jgi:hypothetical protein